jgi:hypothetical protein
MIMCYKEDKEKAVNFDCYGIIYKWFGLKIRKFNNTLANFIIFNSSLWIF